MPRVLRFGLYALAGVVALVAVLLLAWQFDLRRHDGRVLRNVVVAGRPVGGASPVELRAAVQAAANRLERSSVDVRASRGGFSARARELGVRVSVPRTTEAVLAVGRRGSPFARLRDWLASFARERVAPVQVAFDADALHETVAERDRERREPVEPSIAYRGGSFVVVPGKDGHGIDPARLAERIRDAARGGPPIVVKVERSPVRPRVPESDARRLATTASRRVSSPLDVKAGTTRAAVPVATQRAWVTSRANGDRLELALDHEHVLADLGRLLRNAGEKPEETRFVVDAGGVRIIPGKPGTACCAAEAAEAVERAIVDGADEPVDLALRDEQPKLTAAEAAALQIEEPVASFTTRHRAGEPRVRNIHRIADLLRGKVIEPGETFSVNSTVGRRTTEKGFVPAPVIEEGRFTEDVGGGISQFATTLFNAAFFAGLDFEEYQSHSIYISRYPRGREATLSYPRPDLEILNSTPYGVLIWPSYTESSITVTLYSKKYVEVAQTGQSEAPRGACTRVATERTRTYLDGREQVDKVYATYRPAEGVQC